MKENKRTWLFIYHAILYPLTGIASAIFLILTVRLSTFTTADKYGLIAVIVVAFTATIIIMTYHFLKKDGFIATKKTPKSK
ncbi:hypothetical protein [Oenococcus sicerae]|uniref:hypothetical protein n=1 Tax=Oenococcus sicerae TaxID=2203724 RepID=UPI0010BAD810|nr:hypothetical protein OAL24_01338 [Oenococcus sicerae]